MLIFEKQFCFVYQQFLYKQARVIKIKANKSNISTYQDNYLLL